MKYPLFVMLALGPSGALVFAQSSSDQEFARLLANDETRAAAVAAVRQDKVPLLISWTRTPPVGVNKNELYIGMADAFGELRTREAVPFLIKNINLNRWGDVTTWLKTADVIKDRSPAVAALIKIGPNAMKKLIRASWGPMLVKDRCAAIFAISMIASGTKDPEARAFLASALGEATLQRDWAQEGLKLLDQASK